MIPLKNILSKNKSIKIDDLIKDEYKKLCSDNNLNKTRK
jgi:hypothetical protein